MEKKLKSRLLSLKAIFLCTSLHLCAHETDINFDLLFPMTWYQKCLYSTMSLWHAMHEFIEKNETDNSLQRSLVLLLGHVTYAQFCIDHMVTQKLPILDEDSRYLLYVIDDIRLLAGAISVSPELYDYVKCLFFMVKKMQKKLKLTIYTTRYQGRTCLP